MSDLTLAFKKEVFSLSVNNSVIASLYLSAFSPPKSIEFIIGFSSTTIFNIPFFKLTEI